MKLFKELNSLFMKRWVNFIWILMGLSFGAVSGFRGYTGIANVGFCLLGSAVALAIICILKLIVPGTGTPNSYKESKHND